MVKKFVEYELAQAPVDSAVGVDILDSRGQLLMPADAILSQQAIDRLTTREIKTVTIVEQEEMTEEQLAVLVEEIENTINHRFRNSHEIPLMEDLRKALINYRIKELES